MTDKKQLELAAKAAGIKLKWMTQIGNGVKPDEHFISNWHPLTDDGDALRLAVKLGINVPTRWEHEKMERCGLDVYAATRRAIVRAAAEIGKNVP